MNKITLASRMKEYYEHRTRTFLPRRTKWEIQNPPIFSQNREFITKRINPYEI